jgi:hypothetical protein
MKRYTNLILIFVILVFALVFLAACPRVKGAVTYQDVDLPVTKTKYQKVKL